MPNLNKVQLMGNLTRDPETRFTPKGTAVTEFTLATKRRWSSEDGTAQEETTFVDLTFWGRSGEVIAKYCKKGNPLYIEGRLHLDTWTDKESGQNRSKMRVIGENFQFLSTGQRSEKASASSEPTPQPPAAPSGGEGEDDIPF